MTRTSTNAHDHIHEGDDHDHDHASHTHAPDDHAEHDHHDHDHGDHDHAHAEGPLGWLRELLPFGHGHSHSELNVDDALESNARGIWAVKVSLAGLGVTATLQLLVVLLSGSVALLADTIHNFSDALTAVPLWIAFTLSSRPPNRRFTYGYGRAEDVAGVLIVVMIFASSILAAVASLQRLIHPHPVAHLWVVAVASLIGFFGNEGVALLRLRVGNEIGSAALVADGMHARTDGLTSLAVLVGVIFVALGVPLADPILGLLITIAILVIVRESALTMWYRLMDAVDPAFVTRVEAAARAVPGVQGVSNVRVRWIGHRQAAELHALVDADLTTRASHAIVEEVRHALFHALPKLTEVIVHADPTGDDHHVATAHHAITYRATPAKSPAH